MLSLLTNTSASTAQRNLDSVHSRLTRSLEKLSSGLRVNRASDDVASMAIGSRINAELTALREVSRNTNQAISLTQIAEGTYARVNDMLVRMKSLTVQAANGTLSDTERQLLDVEFQALVDEVDRVAMDTTFNGEQVVASQVTLSQAGGITDIVATYSGIPDASQVAAQITNVDLPMGLGRIFIIGVGGNNFSTGVDGGSSHLAPEYLTGNVVNQQVTLVLASTTTDDKIALVIEAGTDLTLGGGFFPINVAVANDANLDGDRDFDFRVGTGSNAAEDVISAGIRGVTAQQLGLRAPTGGLNITTALDADGASLILDRAIDFVIEARAEVGAIQNRLETAKTNLATIIENTESAKSAYLDADIAQEITKFTADQILTQAGISALAQANQLPQALLELFR